MPPVWRQQCCRHFGYFFDCWACSDPSHSRVRALWEELGINPIELEVLETSVIVEGKKNQINRVVLNTEMEFEKIDNILVSQNIPLTELRPGFQYVHVVLYASSLSQTTPLIFRYLYKTRLKST